MLVNELSIDDLDQAVKKFSHGICYGKEAEIQLHLI